MISALPFTQWACPRPLLGTTWGMLGSAAAGPWFSAGYSCSAAVLCYSPRPGRHSRCSLLTPQCSSLLTTPPGQEAASAISLEAQRSHKCLLGCALGRWGDGCREWLPRFCDTLLEPPVNVKVWQKSFQIFLQISFSIGPRYVFKGESETSSNDAIPRISTPSDR